MFVNVYLRDRAYGGPEEGGWWYDTLEPVKSIATTCPRVSERVLERVRRVLDCWNEGRYPISSVLSQGVYEAYIERKPGRYQPERRPHYE